MSPKAGVGNSREDTRRSAAPREEVAAALVQLVAWGNLESQPDMTWVSTLNDDYRACLLYRLSRDGEAVEAGLRVFAQSLIDKAEEADDGVDAAKAHRIVSQANAGPTPPWPASGYPTPPRETSNRP